LKTEANSYSGSIQSKNKKTPLLTLQALVLHFRVLAKEEREDSERKALVWVYVSSTVVILMFKSHEKSWFP
jgi:hypothetical protein